MDCSEAQMVLLSKLLLIATVRAARATSALFSM
jgi:hypothetical protein